MKIPGQADHADYLLTDPERKLRDILNYKFNKKRFACKILGQLDQVDHIDRPYSQNYETKTKLIDPGEDLDLVYFTPNVLYQCK